MLAKNSLEMTLSQIKAILSQHLGGQGSGEMQSE